MKERKTEKRPTIFTTKKAGLNLANLRRDSKLLFSGCGSYLSISSVEASNSISISSWLNVGYQ